MSHPRRGWGKSYVGEIPTPCGGGEKAM